VKREQLAATLYSLRDLLKTRDGIRATLERLAAIGYPAVQVSAISWDLITPEDLARLCADLGLSICATHEPGDVLLGEPHIAIDRLRALGCAATAYPYPAGIDLGGGGAVDDWIDGLERSALALREAGITLTYHNHHVEFRRIDGELILERIYRRAPTLQAEIDTYWVQFGGGDPVAWCRRMSGRLPLLHLKDYRVDDENNPTVCEVGEGNLDMAGIVRAGEEAGCEWFIVEQDVCPGDPLDSLAVSFRNLSALCE
jgi:sugar phosphate isomerase/epimerase